MISALLVAAVLGLTKSPTHGEILTAIQHVESSGKPNPPDGDDGKAIGPLQIHEVYWRDAVAYDRSHGGRLGLAKGSYQDCRKLAYARKVVEAYCLRYCPKAWKARNAEVIARTHNGGPYGPRKKATLGYWRKVKAALAKAQPPRSRR